ncbi:MAG: antitoxin [Firmicutes bacterium]|nr:antitoxin [Bacillota bacterium]
MPLSEAQKRANRKYEVKNCERISVLVRKGEKAAIQAFAKSTGESLNGFIKRAIQEAMERGTPNV